MNEMYEETVNNFSFGNTTTVWKEIYTIHMVYMKARLFFFSPLSCSSAGKKFLFSATSDFPVSVQGLGYLGGIKLCSPTDR